MGYMNGYNNQGYNNQRGYNNRQEGGYNNQQEGGYNNQQGYSGFNSRFARDGNNMRGGGRGRGRGWGVVKDKRPTNKKSHPYSRLTKWKVTDEQAQDNWRYYILLYTINVFFSLCFFLDLRTLWSSKVYSDKKS